MGTIWTIIWKPGFIIIIVIIIIIIIIITIIIIIIIKKLENLWSAIPHASSVFLDLVTCYKVQKNNLLIWACWKSSKSVLNVLRRLRNAANG